MEKSAKKAERAERKEAKKEAKKEKRREENRRAAAEELQRKQSERYDADGNVVTSYDKKVQQRKKEAKKDRRNGVIARICIAAAVIVICAGIVWAAAGKLYYRYGTAVTVDDEKIGRVEFDFYYNMTVNNFLNTYGSYASYLGLDTEGDFSKQTYQDDETWEDYFNDSAVTMLKQIKALAREAEKASFEYDVTDDYNEFTESVDSAAQEEGVSSSDYYKEAFGKYATRSRIEEYAKEYLYAEAYYDDYQENVTLTDAKQDEYYKENKDTYDVVDYRYLEVADADSANDMLDAITDSASFKDLCVQYADESVKSEYQSSDRSLSTGALKSGIAAGTEVEEWLFDSARKEGDKAVIQSSETSKNYVVYFISRYLTDAQKTIMQDNLRSDMAEEYIEDIVKDMTVHDGSVKLYRADEQSQEQSEEQSGE